VLFGVADLQKTRDLLIIAILEASFGFRPRRSVLKMAAAGFGFGRHLPWLALLEAVASTPGRVYAAALWNSDRPRRI
jgi:hypothetical protein